MAESIPQLVGPSRKLRAGFTLIDVLVSISVVGVLIAIMLPSLASVKETAHQVVCRSNVRQIGFAFDMYAETYKQYIPYTVTVPGIQDMINDTSYNTLTVRFKAGDEEYNLTEAKWDGLGLLFAEEILAVPKVFYCPSHKGDNPFRARLPQWGTTDEVVVANYQYRGRGPTGAAQPRMSNRLNLIKPSATLVADGIRTQADFNHQIGANILRADLSVDWFTDSSRTVVDSLPKDSESPSTALIQSVWSQFDLDQGR